VSAPTPLRVGVFTGVGGERPRRLLAALGEAFPVTFEERHDGELRELDAALELGATAQAEAAAIAGLPALALLSPEPTDPGEAAVNRIADSPALARPLRGAELGDGRLKGAPEAGAPAALDSRASALATCDGKPTWIRADRLRTALLVPADLEADEALRERLRDGRSAALLPLVHFLRELTAAIAWQPPAPRATLLFDDPNLHWPSYGFVRLRALAADAREHGYHASLATVPLDGRLAHPGAVRALREGGGTISLSVHGNDHYGAELGAIESEREAIALAAQARRRCAAFAARNGIRVDPVMVPPHEECSRPVATALRRCGFEAITMTRPFPWLAPLPLSWLTRPAAVGPLAGWRPADRAEGLAVFLRHPFAGRSPAELALRAFLGQPLILYGHQADLREGLGVLRSTAADVDRLGPARWCSLGEIAAGSYETRREGSALAIRPLARRAILDVPADVDRLIVSPREDGTGPVPTRLLVDGHPQPLDQPVLVNPATAVELELGHDDEADPSTVPAPRPQPLALPRRLLSEGRDRLAPLVSHPHR
jgi:hypothetical protein